MFITLTVVVLSWVCAYVQTHQIVFTKHVQGFVGFFCYRSYTSIKLFFKRFTFLIVYDCSSFISLLKVFHLVKKIIYSYTCCLVFGLFPAFNWWVFGMFPNFCYYEQCFHEHNCACLLVYICKNSSGVPE